MRIQRLDAQTIGISGLDDLLTPVLLGILSSADTEGSPEAHQRLFTSPTEGADPEVDEDWREYVVPDLQEQFDASLKVVAGDLRQLQETAEGEPHTLRIAVHHLDSWISALNQARLALHARHHLTEEEMEGDPAVNSERGYVLFQMFFYGVLLDTFIRQAEQMKPTLDEPAPE